MKELIGGHDALAECAVVGIDDQLKGQLPIVLAVLKDGIEVQNEVLESELIALIRQEIGAVEAF